MILVCGEALIDLFVDNATGAALPARAVAGGSPFNTAVGLARLGIGAGFLGGLSTDSFGHHLARCLSREGVDLSYAVRSERLTTLSVVATDSGGHPAYAFHGEGKADRVLTSNDLPARLPASIAALVFGSYTLAVEPVGAALLALAQREARHRPISLDPNLRPGVIGDLAAWRVRFEAFLATATLVKASDEDIALGYGPEPDIDRVAADWLARGPSLVVVTRGEKGALAYTRTHRLEVPGRRVAVIDTVGAGDSFHAALLAWLQRAGALTFGGIAALQPAKLTEALTYATTAAALTCSRRGADLPNLAEVAARLEVRE